MTNLAKKDIRLFSLCQIEKYITAEREGGVMGWNWPRSRKK